MFVIRQATPDDLPALYKLARMVHFINLPADRDALGEKIATSRGSFAAQIREPREQEFLFVLEEIQSREVIGTAGLIPRVSWPGHPNLHFQVRRRQHFSEHLGTGQVHETIQLCADQTGPSEVGGLILQPGFRGHKQKLGLFLSLIRFHFIGLHLGLFSKRIMAEMMGALSADGRSTLWEFLGRRFINLSYTEADLFSTRSKEFIQSLFPSVEIYTSLLPPEARRLIAEVGEETRPAVHLLESQGFVYRDQCDPFDGGPYLEAECAAIPVVRATRRMRLLGVKAGGKEEVFVSHSIGGAFRAMRCRAVVSRAGVSLPRAVAEEIGAEVGSLLGVTVLRGARTKPAAGMSLLADNRADAAPIEPGEIAGGGGGGAKRRKAAPRRRKSK